MNLTEFDLLEVEARQVKKALPDRMGVYTLSIRGGDTIIDSLGFEYGGLPLINSGTFTHLYTGESIGIRSRVLSHLSGDIRASNLRHTLLAMQVEYKILEPGLRFNSLLDAEVWLSDWLAQRAQINFKCCPFARDVEADILAATASPLNLKRKARTALSRRLAEARARLSEQDWITCGLSQLPPARRYRR